MTQSGKRFLAFVALKEQTEVSPEHFVEAVRLRASAFASHMKTVSAGPDGAGGFIVQIGPLAISVISVPQPMPQGTLDQAISLARTWPDAHTAMQSHKAHVIIGLIQSPEDHHSAIAQARVVSLLTAAVCSITPSIGVYWATGEVLTEATVFQNDLTKSGYLTEFWISLRWLDGPRTPNGERTLAVTTTGLLPFIGRELELEPVSLPPVYIAGRILGVLQHLLANGPVLKDGDTVGATPTEIIRVRHASQGQQPGVPVLSLSFEKPESLTNEFKSKLRRKGFEFNDVIDKPWHR